MDYLSNAVTCTLRDFRTKLTSYVVCNREFRIGSTKHVAVCIKNTFITHVARIKHNNILCGSLIYIII